MADQLSDLIAMLSASKTLKSETFSREKWQRLLMILLVRLKVKRAQSSLREMLPARMLTLLWKVLQKALPPAESSILVNMVREETIATCTQNLQQKIEEVYSLMELRELGAIWIHHAQIVLGGVVSVPLRRATWPTLSMLFDSPRLLLDKALYPPWVPAPVREQLSDSGTIGPAMKELDAAEASALQIFCMSLRLWFFQAWSAQVASMNESMQPPATQCERWLQSAVSLCLRSLHQLAAVPQEVASELQLQARALLARAYSMLGRLYASTGRFTKAMTHAKQGIELFNATKDKLEAAKLQIWLCRLQLRMAVPQAASATRSTDCLFLDKDPSLLGGLSASAPAEETALQQVVQQLQKALGALDSSAALESQAHSEGQVLLGKVLLRQALVRLAVAKAPLNTCSRLVEEESILVSALDLLQVPDAKMAQSPTDGGKQVVERLHQAATCFRSAEAPVPCCSVHACLAFVYFCTAGADSRLQKLAVTHCQHALDQWASAPIDERVEAVGVALKLLEAKAARRTSQKGRPAWTGDAKAASLLCEVAVSRLASPEHPETPCRGGESPTQAGEPAAGGAPQQSRDEQVRNALLSTGEDQGASLMSYLRQELSTVLLRLLKACDQEDFGRDLKAAYCSLLTAWHEASGQVEALNAVAAHTRRVLGRDLPS
ncbi:UBE3A [Symbiodinium pilosum]|uniref:UBE3A protein n=1 Tax=Symbiodinium pilosum TaxID=2952 RepID=A0A812VIQ8_SYMPI|nr:UBE3A [Symbiodinium pilosum]